MNGYNIAKIIEKFAPNADHIYVMALTDADNIEAMRQYGIITDSLRLSNLRLAHFLAQIFHETQLLTRRRENMKYSANRIRQIFGVGRHSAGITDAEAIKLAGKEYDLAERVYGVGNPKKSKELGNTNVGDGWKYRAIGLMGTTGKYNVSRVAERIAKRLGKDSGFARRMVENPESMLLPQYVLYPALLAWDDGAMNDLADVNDIGAITKKINGGYNGLQDRKNLFAKIYAELTGAGGNDAWSAANSSERVRKYQLDLITLGYAIKADGLHGPKTDKAVRDFQRKSGIPADGVVGHLTLDAIEQALNRRADPTSRPRKVDDMDTMTSGATVTGTGIATEALISASRQITDLGLDSPVIRAIPVILILVGCAITLAPVVMRAIRSARDE